MSYVTEKKKVLTFESLVTWGRGRALDGVSGRDLGRGRGETYSGKWKGKHVFHEDFKEECPSVLE